MPTAQEIPQSVPRLPEKPVARLTQPLMRVLQIEASSGILLFLCAATAFALANSPWAEPVAALWSLKVGLAVGDAQYTHSLLHWINDGLMTLFFFVVGLEVKRELTVGELREPQNAALPIAGAIGGMLVPAAIYLGLQMGRAGQHGWGIPMATDIAFVVGVLALVGSRVPHGLRVMLVSLAIVDDIGAIMVIALGYTQSLDMTALALGGIGLLAILGLARMGVRNVGVYWLVGALVWVCFHESGVHATVAGVILGLMTPATKQVDTGLFRQIAQRASETLSEEIDSPQRAALLRHVSIAGREAMSPLERLELQLHPWVSFAVMPVFALANTGVATNALNDSDQLGWAVGLGLVLGKPLGIVLFCWLAVAVGMARLPKRVSWLAIVGAGCLGGIGFTMALYIASLALESALLDAAKVAILLASAISAVMGAGILLIAYPSPAAEASTGEGSVTDISSADMPVGNA